MDATLIGNLDLYLELQKQGIPKKKVAETKERVRWGRTGLEVRRKGMAAIASFLCSSTRKSNRIIHSPTPRTEIHYIYKEIKDIFDGVGESKKFFCHALLRSMKMQW